MKLVSKLYTKSLCILLTLVGLQGCTTPALENTVTTSNLLQLEHYFAGKTQAHGVLLDRSGNASRYFEVDIIGTWTPETRTLILDESFKFNDGENSKRIWTITKQANNQYSGTAADVVGTAQGTVKDNILNWQYTLTIPYQGRKLDIQLDDWLYLMNDQVLLNKAIMTKWGVKVGEIIITFKKP